VLDLIKTTVTSAPIVGSPLFGALHGAKKGLKDFLQPQVLFEDLGIKYIGPIDGHDEDTMEQALRQATEYGGPVLVHAITRKGFGYPLAEQNEEDRLHQVPGTSGKPATDPGVAPKPAKRSWTDVYGEEILAIGARRPDVVAITAAMLHPVGLAPFKAAYPDRVYDAGIAEQHAMTMAAGLAMAGLHPVVSIYATFLNRAFDQLLMDVALHELPVTFVLDRAGVTGSDGASHNGMWDLSLLGLVPGVRVAAPRDGDSLRRLLAEAVDWPGPAVLRFPKADLGVELPAAGHIGGADIIYEPPGASVLMLVAGPLAGTAVDAARRLELDGIGVRVVDPRWLLPVEPALADAVGRHRLTVTVEDGGVAGGFGASVVRACPGRRVEVLGLDQEFLEHGSRSQLLSGQGLDADGIVTAVRRAVQA
jgi:1-deoxy-D-xylulose-5-phosphate synthase